MSLQLVKLQESDEETRKIRAKGLNRYKKIDKVLHHQKPLFVSEIFQIELINWHHNDSLVCHFSINKIEDFIRKEYYWLSLQKDIKVYVKDYNIYLGLKVVRYKPYNHLQSLFVPTYQ